MTVETRPSWPGTQGRPACFVVNEKDNLLVRPDDDLSSFLEKDLDVTRIDEIFNHLWMVGRPLPPRAVNIQIVLGRKIVTTTDVSLHLVWHRARIFIKPLPSYVFEQDFYEKFLAPERGAVHERPDTKLRKSALGFVYSYVALIRNELDFSIAKEKLLLPASLEWENYKAMVHQLLGDYNEFEIYRHVAKRYIYGELRFGRLDYIYRYRRLEWLHGYSKLMGSATYGNFLDKYSGRILATTAYVALALTAMQVGLADEILMHNDAFKSACYGFTIFAIIAPLAAIGLIILLAVVMVIANWVKTTVFGDARSKRIFGTKRFQDKGPEPKPIAQSNTAWKDV